jgi:hypothetical protein
MVGRVSDASFACDYSPYARRVRGVYLPVTLSAVDRAAHLVIRVGGFCHIMWRKVFP